MVEHLCRTFREYKRKPKGVFSKTVERAIAFVLAQDGKIHKKKEKEEEEGIDGEEKEEEDGDDDYDDDDDDDDYDDDDDDDDYGW